MLLTLLGCNESANHNIVGAAKKTQSGDRYNLINQLPQMDGIVDVARLSPQPTGTFEWLHKFQRNVAGKQPVALQQGDCNGYWLNLAGMQRQPLGDIL